MVALIIAGPIVMPQVDAVPVLTKFHQNQREEEVGKRKGCPSRARRPQAGKPARKFAKGSYILDVKVVKLTRNGVACT